MAFLSENELNDIGFKSLGRNVKISKKTSIFAPQNISIGDNVRIDDFCVLSAFGGYINLHNHIHIAVFCNLIGKGGIEMKDYSGLSSRVSLYSASDDYSGDYLIGPIMENECLKIIEGPIVLEKFVTIGTNSVVFPKVTLNEGSVLGSCSLLTKDTEKWSVYVGVTAKKIKARNKGLLDLVYIMEEKWK
jgi:acetyltransferase-like isoleucine patch superfamily enzyme